MLDPLRSTYSVPINFLNRQRQLISCCLVESISEGEIKCSGGQWSGVNESVPIGSNVKEGINYFIIGAGRAVHDEGHFPISGVRLSFYCELRCVAVAVME